MALASDIVRRSYRESNLIPLGQNPNANQLAEGLETLNSLILSTVGNEVGTPVNELMLGGDFDESQYLVDYVPKNTRLVLNLDAPTLVGLNPRPREGERFAVVDSGGNLSSNTLTIDGNGRNIEGLPEVVVDTDYLDRQWMYRADTANWVRISALVAADNMPFPSEFDDYFITMLAMRIDPRFSQTLGSESIQALQRSRSQIRARYCQINQVESDLKSYGLSANRRNTYYGSPSDSFTSGKPFPYL